MSKTKTRKSVSRYARTCWFLLLFLGNGSPALFADWREEIGYNKLVSALGASLPDGAGVPIALVEAPTGENDTYFPDTADTQFDALSDPGGIPITFTDGSGGQSQGISGHSNSQGQTIFGNTSSVAPSANEVTVYEANDFLATILNMNGSNTVSPDVQNFRVQNFSWIGTYAITNDGTPEPTATELNNDREALRRFDYAIDTNNITAVVGLGNTTQSLPHLLSHSYNSIAVGRSDGLHSSGLTHLADYGVGRSKPELVSPRTTTSAATSTVSSVATLLHSSNTVLGTDADRSQTMKAILLAGATKDFLPAELPPWSQIDSGGEWHPLDDTYGAGEVNIYNSYLVALGGQAVGSTTTPTPVASHGWDYQTIQPGPGNELLYDFVIPTGSIATELSIALAWNAKIESPFNTGYPILANLDLKLVDDSGMTIDFDIDDNVVEGLSASEVDNVEHLYLTNLTAGTYTLEVSSEDLATNNPSSALASDFGLSWRTSTLFEASSADYDEDGDTDGADFLAWQRGFGTLINATHADGDADGDGDIDEFDLVLYEAERSAAAPGLSSSLATVPEPESWVMAGVGLLLTLGLRGNLSRSARKA